MTWVPFWNRWLPKKTKHQCSDGLKCYWYNKYAKVESWRAGCCERGYLFVAEAVDIIEELYQHKSPEEQDNRIEKFLDAAEDWLDLVGYQE